MPTNKSHYPPQAILSDPPRPLGEPTPWVEPSRETRETFPPRAEEKRGLSQDDRDLPLLRRRTPNSLKEFLPSSFTPLAFSSGIKDEGRHTLRKETRELCNFMNGEEKVGQKRERERKRNVMPDTFVALFVAMNEMSDGAAPRERWILKKETTHPFRFGRRTSGR